MRNNLIMRYQVQRTELAIIGFVRSCDRTVRTMEIKEYSWWGFDENSPPETLKTKKQLSALGLKPGQPVGVIRTPDYDCYLYDPATCPAKRPLTQKQKEAIARRKLLKEQAKLEQRKQQAWQKLELYLKSISRYIQDVVEEVNDPLESIEWRERYIKRLAERIITNCRHAKEELEFLFPHQVPLDMDGQCRAAVLGGNNPVVPLDPDGVCRAAVLGGKHKN